MTTFNITILLGGGKTQTLEIDASKYTISSDGMVKFYNQEDKLTHCYPSTRVYFTIEYDKFDFN